MKSALIFAVASLLCGCCLALPYVNDGQLEEYNIQQLREFLESRKIHEESEVDQQDAARDKQVYQPIAYPENSESEREIVDEKYGVPAPKEPEQSYETYVFQEQENQQEERNSVDAELEQDERSMSETVDNVDDVDDDVIMQERALPKDIKSLFDQKVVKSERYQYARGKWNEAGVVVTLTEGNRLLILCRSTDQNRFSQWMKEQPPYVLLDARVMTDAWKLTETKNLEKSTLADFIKICGKSPSPFESADTMLALS